MSQQDMLQNEALEEILRERANYYFSKSKSLDFWILISPNFLLKIQKKIENSGFYKQKEKLIKNNNENLFYSVLITSNKEFLGWISLRLGYFENFKNIENSNIVDITNYTCDGVYGEFEEKNFLPLLNSVDNNLHSDIFTKKFNKINTIN
jgi:hypothetical protein